MTRHLELKTAVMDRKSEQKAEEALRDAPQAKISARHVDVYYGEKQALTDVSLDINAREVTALIGPSGCGKSTSAG